jgi:long-chain fatty acid transport protein
LLLLAWLLTGAAAHARPYPGLSGLTATADSAATAGTNPAGSTRFSKRAIETELMWFGSESTWESGFEEGGAQTSSRSESDTVVPRVFYIEPLSDRFAFAFTVLGAGFSDDLGEWPGRYFIQNYDALYINALPSLAYRIDEKWSIAGSVAISYASYEQKRAVANIFDPGFGDGKSEIETDSIEFGYGFSALYEPGERTRLGLNYASRIDATQEGDNKLTGLGPRTSEIMEQLGVIGAELEVESTSPQSLFLGVYHEFPNRHAVTLDAAWIDFSEFRLSEFYFNGEGFIESDPDYNDIYALAASYTWPVAQRWMLGVGGLVTSQLVEAGLPDQGLLQLHGFRRCPGDQRSHTRGRLVQGRIHRPRHVPAPDQSEIRWALAGLTTRRPLNWIQVELTAGGRYEVFVTASGSAGLCNGFRHIHRCGHRRPTRR